MQKVTTKFNHISESSRGWDGSVDLNTNSQIIFVKHKVRKVVLKHHYLHKRSLTMVSRM